MDDPHKDLRSLGDRLFDKRDLPIAAGLAASKPAANLIRRKSFYFATDTGVLWYSDGTSWVAASNAFGPKVYVATPILTNGTTSSTTYTDLSDTAGPTLTGLPDGGYLFLFGALAENSVDGTGFVMSLSYNGSGPDDAESAQAQTGVLSSIMRATTATLANSNNSTVTAKYRVGANTGSFQFRWLVGVKTS